jgi:Fe-Mn family superoxide dismutase
MITRRQAINATLLTGAAIATQPWRNLWAEPTLPTPPTAPAPPPATGPFKLPPLPYAYDALEPYIDAETMRIHHDKHHAAYVEKLNGAVATQPSLGTLSVEEILKSLDHVDEPIRKTVRNNGGGDYNHTLFWQMMKPKGGGEPTGELGKAIAAKFGSFADFKKKFGGEATGVFGSGWAWLILDGKNLAIDSTPNQDAPISQGKTQLLGIDIWEHAYYLKHQNRRAEYIEAWWNVVNWDFAEERYKVALA